MSGVRRAAGRQERLTDALKCSGASPCCDPQKPAREGPALLC